MLFQKLSGRRTNTGPNNSPGAAKTLWSWGANAAGGSQQNHGQVGDITTITRSSPVQLGTLAAWSTLPTGFNASVDMAIKNDGTLWGWGYNGYGQLGVGDVVRRSSPTQIGTLGTWASVQVGQSFTVSKQTNNTLWGWGYGVLTGVGDAIRRSSPAQIGTLTTWATVGLGNAHALAIRSDSTLWAWGINRYGQLAQGDRGVGWATGRSSPIQVGTLAGWSAVAGGGEMSLAVRDDGTLWAWGQNGSGHLGLSDIIARSSPAQVGTLAGWSKVVGGPGSQMGIRTDGTLWSWGINSFGVLGIGDRVDRSSPVQVGTLAVWSQVRIACNFVTAIKTDGTLWTWGRNVQNNNYGVLGLGDIASRSSPVQVGTLAGWQNLGGAYYTMQALRL